ncbi:hypothetical protein L9F63_006757, partial [Diploptera punctata]
MKAVLPPTYTEYASYFNDALRFLRDYSWIYNFAAPHLLVQNILEKIPQDWAFSLLSLTNEELNEFPQGLVKDSWPATLVSFCYWCKKLKIPHQESIHQDIDMPDKIRRGLNPKKQHEVTSMAKLVRRKCSTDDITQVLDMGSGLGYLDQLLHHHYGYNIIGLESEADRVMTATQRQLDLCPTPAVKHVICNISLDSKCRIESELNATASDTCMVGLHICGDLAVTAIQLFMQIEVIKLMIIVPCCYHKMALIGEKEFANFPLSSSLNELYKNKFCDCQGFLSRPFLRLASQETTSRWFHMSEEKHKEHSENLMARAVLQLCFHNGGMIVKKKKRRVVRKTKRTEFNSFMEDAISRFDLAAEHVTPFRQEMAELWEQHKSSCRLAEVLTALQMAIQNIVESFVHADWVAYLHEHGVTSVEIVKVMDDALSPRCWALIARK